MAKRAEKKTTTKASRPPRNRRTDPNAPGADGGDGPGAGHNSRSKLTFEAEQQLFLQHRESWNQAQAKLKVAEKLLADVVVALKSDGFTKKMFVYADDLGTPKGEKRVVTDVADRVKVARFMGHPLGAAQLDLFNEGTAVRPKPLTIEDCYEEGKRTSMENKPGKPPAHYSAEQIQAFMSGYHDHQRELAGGIKAPASHGGSSLAHAEPEGNA